MELQATKKQQHARFIAQKLFVSEEDCRKAQVKGDTDSNAAPAPNGDKDKGKGVPEGTAVSKLSFAEKLHVMILQVEDL